MRSSGVGWRGDGADFSYNDAGRGCAGGAVAKPGRAGTVGDLHAAVRRGCGRRRAVLFSPAFRALRRALRAAADTHRGRLGGVARGAVAVLAAAAETQPFASPLDRANLPAGSGGRLGGRIRLGFLFRRRHGDAPRLRDSGGAVVLHGRDGVPLREGGTNRRASPVDDPEFFAVAGSSDAAAVFAVRAVCAALAVFARVCTNFVVVLGAKFDFGGMDDSAALGSGGFVESVT